MTCCVKLQSLIQSNTTRAQWVMGIAQWLECQTPDRKVAGSNPGRSGMRIFFSGVDFLCWLLFWYLFHPRVTAVARKRSWSFCQKCRWQVTAKHPYTLHGFKWSDTVNWCMVEWCAQNLRWDCSISHGTSHATTKERCQYTTSVDINNTHHKMIQSLIQNHMWQVRSESAWERRIALYKSYE